MTRHARIIILALLPAVWACGGGGGNASSGTGRATAPLPAELEAGSYVRDSIDTGNRTHRIYGNDSVYIFNADGHIKQITYSAHPVNFITFGEDSTVTYIRYNTEQTGGPLLGEGYWEGSGKLKSREVLIDSTVMMGAEVRLYQMYEFFHENGQLDSRHYDGMLGAHGISAGGSVYYDEEGVLLKKIVHTVIIPDVEPQGIGDYMFGYETMYYAPDGKVDSIQYYECGYEDLPDYEDWTWYDKEGNVVRSETVPSR